MTELKTPVGPEDHSLGPEEAPITLLEYGDYQCPHCGHAYPIVKAVQEKLGNRLRFVFRNFPLREMHPMAEAAAESAEYAGSQGRFWEMHDLLFENQGRLSESLLLELVQQLRLDARDLQKSLREHSYLGRVQKEFASGVRSGVNGTPTFFINGSRHDGDFEFATLVRAIESYRA